MKHLIGHKVEDFKVQAYHQGDFKEVTLQDTKGHWSIFFFYPADFTFVCPTYGNFFGYMLFLKITYKVNYLNYKPN